MRAFRISNTANAAAMAIDVVMRPSGVRKTKSKNL